MAELAESLDHLIASQVATGTASSEAEAEQKIINEIEQRVLDRKLAKAQAQVINGEFTKLDSGFSQQFVARARKRNGR